MHATPLRPPAARSTTNQSNQPALFGFFFVVLGVQRSVVRPPRTRTVRPSACCFRFLPPSATTNTDHPVGVIRSLFFASSIRCASHRAFDGDDDSDYVDDISSSSISRRELKTDSSSRSRCEFLRRPRRIRRIRFGRRTNGMSTSSDTWQMSDAQTIRNQLRLIELPAMEQIPKSNAACSSCRSFV